MAETSSTGRLHLVVVSHEKKLLEVDCDEVSLPGREGDLGILPGHTAIICTLRPGVLSYRAGSTVERAVVATGFAQVFGDAVTVLVDRAQLPAEIDAAAAAEELREIEKRVPFAEADEVEALQDRQREAEARVSVARG